MYAKFCSYALIYTIIILHNNLLLTHQSKQDFDNLSLNQPTIEVVTQNSIDTNIESIGYFLPENFTKKDLNSDLQNLHIDIVNHLQNIDFKGKKNTITEISIPFHKDKTLTRIFFTGLGKIDQNNKDLIESFRRGIGNIITSAQHTKVKNLTIILPTSSYLSMQPQECIQQAYIISKLATYTYDMFITDKEKHHNLSKITLAVTKEDQQFSSETVLKNAHAIGEAVNKTRLWTDTPPSKLPPKTLSSHIKKLAKIHGLKCTILNEKEMKRLGMGGIIGVSQGSSQEAQCVILEYKTNNKQNATIGLAGKGVTFDSGGLSLKPTEYMDTMKYDMAGAASVVNTIIAISEIKPHINVIGIVPLTENMPGCSAIKPGDIVTFYNGKTAEVLNTDAEGRLILADAISYITKHYKLDCVIDVATLTGASKYALGPFYTPLISDTDSLIQKIQKSADHTGDKVWQLPFHEDFNAAITSNIADIQNIGKDEFNAETITAACFLHNFTNNIPWAHLDIANTAFSVPEISYVSHKGATGSSVRLLIDFILNWNKK